MYGNQADPSKIYSFGAKAPHVNAELVDAQMSAGHRYKNQLIELELHRRQCVEEAIAELFPGLRAVEDQMQAAEQECEALQDAIRQQNARQRSRTATAEQREQLRTVKGHLKELRAKRKQARQVAFASPEWKARQREIDRVAGDKQKAARAACGLFWGTYLTVEQSMGRARSGAPPKFRRWTGDGKLAVQIQGGITPAEACEGNGTRLRIVEDHQRSTPRRKRVVVWLRIGSEGRDPVWTQVRATLHRPLPEGCLIKWVYLIRRRIACSYEWSVQFVVACKGGFPRHDQSDSGVVGIDLGWRLVGGGLRVAYWSGDDGDEGQLVLPEKDLSRWPRVETLQSTRDKNFDAARDRLAKWLFTAAGLPDWLIERTQTLRQWRSTARLAALAIHWRTHRFEGDEEAFAPLEAWRKQDRHLYEWERHQHQKAVRWRDDLYRNFAARLRRRYKTAILEDCNWQQVQRRAGPEEQDAQAGARTYMRVASVGRLAQLIGEAMRETVKVPAEYTTRRCHRCGEVNAWDAAQELYHTCATCGEQWDQDANAARNLLAAASAEKK